MSSISHLNQIVQVVKPRRDGYATVKMVDSNGSIISRDKTLVVKFPSHSLEAVRLGSLWQVSGTEKVSQYKINGYDVSEYTITAAEVKYLKPAGRVLSRWISTNVKGVGKTIADRLVRKQGMLEAIRKRDREVLRSIKGMSDDRIDSLFKIWPDDHLYEVIEWLEERHLPLGLGNKLIDVFGSEALEKVKKNPFLLMAMGAPFEKAMEVSKALGLDLADEAVLAGVAQHFTSIHSFDTGSTIIDAETLIEGCKLITGREVPENIGDIAVSAGLLAKVGLGYQVYGTAVQEVSVASFLVDCLTRPPGQGALLAVWERDLTEAEVNNALSKYEKTLDFALTDEQRRAIKGAVMSPLCGISGGAGTGKTTILRGVISVYEALSPAIHVRQVALSGRAAQRMSESTRKPAHSIAKLIYDHIGQGKKELPPHLLLVIDEASMVDLLSMYQLVGILPPATRILFVGDTEQLPPVRAGLIFHELKESGIPFFNLSEVKRQGAESGIHHFAMSIRNDSPEQPEQIAETVDESADCVIEEVATVERLIELWEEIRDEDSIVLSPVRKGELGVLNINKKLQAHVGGDRLPLSYLDEVRGWIPWCGDDGEFLLEGDRVLITKNNYDEDADLRNGDLGVIEEVYDEPDDDNVVGKLLVNGQSIGITRKLLEKITLGYAVTIHKAQGSQWNTCIVTIPKEGLPITDKTLIYTAVTRPTNRLIIIGNFNYIKRAVDKGSEALKRKTYIKKRLEQCIALKNKNETA
ncbi:MAG: AAA family ATPase [Deltaproteobacteria bacterium HGW-Deltaproteobacteria-4]|nr:MAG: AAA family ATPase [Deltaproteobacteria bacterium HGW-Deltaproteobacteria-4]